jgi:hypothetical protein
VPKRAIHPDTKFSAQVEASMFLKGMASTYLVDLSIIVIKYTCPSSEEGRGPTRFTCTCSNLRTGVGKACKGAAGCFVTLLL